MFLNWATPESEAAHMKNTLDAINWNYHLERRKLVGHKILLFVAHKQIQMFTGQKRQIWNERASEREREKWWVYMVYVKYTYTGNNYIEIWLWNLKATRYDALLQLVKNIVNLMRLTWGTRQTNSHTFTKYQQMQF